MRNRYLVAAVSLLMVSIVLAACAGGGSAGSDTNNPGTPALQAPEDTATQLAGSQETPPEDEENQHAGGEEDQHAEDQEMHVDEGHVEEHAAAEHMSGAAHSVPEEALALPNPIEANQANIDAGSALYAEDCATCHGESGLGDGVVAAGLEPRPANLHEDHVQELTDGGLFYIISHGRADTSMPAWEDVLSPEERWQIVNFLRTFQD